MLTNEEKNNRKCTAPNCTGVVYAKGYCNKHYNQLRIHGKLTPDMERAEYSSEDSECSEAMCQGVVVAKGLCMAHYQALRRATMLSNQVEVATNKVVPVRRRVVRRRANG